MALAFDAAAGPTTVNPNTVVTHSHTTSSGSNRIMFIFVLSTLPDVSAATYNGVSSTQVGAYQVDFPSANRYLSVWAILNPASGSNTVSVTTSSSNLIRIESITYTGANQSTTMDATGSGQDTSGSTDPLTVNITTTVANAWVILFARASVGNISAGSSGGTLRTTSNFNGIIDKSTTTAGSQSIGATDGAGSSWGWHVISLAPASTDLSISVSDAITVAETVKADLQLQPHIFDAVTITESVSRTLVNNISVSDAITVSESVNRDLIRQISVSDSVTVAERWVAANTVLLHEGKISLDVAFLEESAGRNIVRDSTGILYAVFNAYNTVSTFYEIYLAKSTDRGQTWVEKSIASSASGSQFTPKIVIDKSDSLTVVWEGYGAANNPTAKNINLKQGTYANIDSATRVQVTDSSVEQFVPTCTIDADNNIHIVWYGLGYGTNTTDYQIVYRKYLSTGSFAAAALALTDEVESQYNPDITADKSNNLHVVWYGFLAGDATYAKIAYIKYDANTLSWGTTDTLSSASVWYGYPSIALDSNDKPHVAYWRNNGAVYYANRVSGSWSAQESLVATGAFSDIRTAIALDKQDNLYFVMEAPTGGSPPQMTIIRKIGGVFKEAKIYTYSKVTYQNKPSLMWSVHPMTHSQQMVPTLGAVGIWEDSTSTVNTTFAGDIYFHQDIDTTFQTDLYIQVNESVTITENKTVNIVFGINVSDAITVSEGITLLDFQNISVSDSVTVTEGLTVGILGGISVSDSVTVAESVVINLLNQPHVSDVVTVTESISMGIGLLDTSDSITVTESVSVTVSIAGISVSDSITVNEGITTSPTLGSISVSDVVAVSESISVSTGYGISVSDSVTVTEGLTLLEFHNINASDAVTITESVSAVLGYGISVSDSVTVTEGTTLLVNFGISVSDAVTVGENTTLDSVLIVGVSDAITVTESVTRDFVFQTSVSDSITVSESVTLLSLFMTNQNPPKAFSDSVGIRGSYQESSRIRASMDF